MVENELDKKRSVEYSHLTDQLSPESHICKIFQLVTEKILEHWQI